MKVTLTEHTKDPEFTIGAAAAECYDASRDREVCLRRARTCKDKGHLATMRFAWASFHVEGISRICSHQLVRIAHAGVLQRSQRYVAESDIKFIRPPAFESLPPMYKAMWDELEFASAELYNQLVTRKHMKKEDARYCLLHSGETSLYICMNFQAWRDFLKNRTDPAAQWEIREVALEIQRQLHGIAPNLFDTVAYAKNAA